MNIESSCTDACNSVSHPVFWMNSHANDKEGYNSEQGLQGAGWRGRGVVVSWNTTIARGKDDASWTLKLQGGAGSNVRLSAPRSICRPSKRLFSLRFAHLCQHYFICPRVVGHSSLASDRHLLVGSPRVTSSPSCCLLLQQVPDPTGKAMFYFYFSLHC